MDINPSNVSEEFKEKLFHFIDLAESNEKYQAVKEEDYDENDPFFKLIESGNIAAIDLLLSVINSKEFHEQVNEKYDRKFNQV